MEAWSSTEQWGTHPMAHRRPSPISGVLFDLDGTIAETHPMAFHIFREAIKAGGGPELSNQDLVAEFGPNEMGVLQSVLGDNWPAGWDHYVEAYRTQHDLAPSPFDGIPEVVADLAARGLGLGLISGKTEKTASFSLEYFGLDHHFQFVRGGAVDELVKAAQITEAVQRWDIAPDSVAYVGDTVGDIHQARDAGVVSVAAAWSGFADLEGLRAEAPDHLFDSVDGFASWVLAAAEG